MHQGYSGTERPRIEERNLPEKFCWWSGCPAREFPLFQGMHGARFAHAADNLDQVNTKKVGKGIFPVLHAVVPYLVQD